MNISNVNLFGYEELVVKDSKLNLNINYLKVKKYKGKKCQKI